MEGFTYTNIFETKGIEYLVIIAFFAVLIPFWMLLNKRVKPAVGLNKVKGFIAAANLQLPQGIFFSRYHTWAHLEKNGEAKVGVNDLILHLTGEVSVKQIKQSGESIGRGEPLARIHYNGKSLEVLSPVSGTICSANPMLSDDPDLVKSDPYRYGWIYSLKPANWKGDTGSCFLAEDATAWAKNELDRFKDFLAVSVRKTMPENEAVVMQDGGEVAEKALIHFPQEVWNDFQKKFLS